MLGRIGLVQGFTPGAARWTAGQDLDAADEFPPLSPAGGTRADTPEGGDAVARAGVVLPT